MARKPRIEFPGAFYYVIARGNRRQVIFFDHADRPNLKKQLRDPLSPSFDLGPFFS